MSEDDRQIISQDHDPDVDESDGEGEFPFPSEMLESLPPEQRSVFRSALSMFMGISRPPSDPIRRRITSEHITQILENQERSGQRNHSSENSDRWLFVWFGTLILAAAVGLIVFFGIRETYEVVTAIIGGLLGFAGGFGVGRMRR